MNNAHIDEIANLSHLITKLRILRAEASRAPAGISYEGEEYRAYLRADHALNQIDAVLEEEENLRPLSFCEEDNSHLQVRREAERDFYATR